jgi:osmotically-inducible protein OsmY
MFILHLIIYFWQWVIRRILGKYKIIYAVIFKHTLSGGEYRVPKHTQHKLGDQNEIIHLIEAALDQEMQLSSLDIHVDIKEDTVLLTGVVDTLAEKAFAQKVASQVPGVKKVENYLTISTDGTFDQITIRIVQKFSTSGLSLPDIAVDTQNGEVFLRGYVEDQHMMEVAEELAMDTPGVKKLNNMLRIRERQ